MGCRPLRLAAEYLPTDPLPHHRIPSNAQIGASGIPRRAEQSRQNQSLSDQIGSSNPKHTPQNWHLEYIFVILRIINSSSVPRRYRIKETVVPRHEES